MKKTGLQYYYLKEKYYTKDIDVKPKINLSAIKRPCTVIMDQATHTGLSLYDYDHRLVLSVDLIKLPGETLTHYKLELGEYLDKLIELFDVTTIYGEDVYGGGNFSTSKKLIKLEGFLEDFSEQRGIACHIIPNKKWKARLSSPLKWDNFQNDKEQVAHFVFEYYPKLKGKISEDVTDSLGIGIAVFFKKEGFNPIEMKLDKKLSFKYDLVLDKEFSLDVILEKSNKKWETNLLDYEIIDYDPTQDFNTNMRYVLTNKNIILITVIPYHRYYGEILLMNDIIPNEIDDDDLLLCIARRTHWRDSTF